MNERMVSIVLLFIILAGLVFAASGCALMRPIRDFVLGIERPALVEIEQTPTNSLWQTVKKAKSNWLTTLAIPIIALGAVAMFNGAAKLGMSCIIFGSVNLFMALATSRFAFWMALFGLIGSAAAVAVSILAKNKALKEMVFGIQNVKTIIPEADNRLKDAKIVLDKQAKSTKKIVAKIKTKAKLKGEM